MEKRRNKKEMLKKVFIIIFVALIISVSGLIYYTNSLVSRAKKCPKEKVITDNTKTIAQLKKQDNILFLGDSITDYYPIDSIYADLPIVKSGISGYKTQDILDRMDSMVYQYNPTKVFLLIGTNDIMYDGEDNKEPTIERIEEIIEKIKKNRSKAKIYLESIYPVNKDVNKSMVKDRDNNIIKEINEELENYCEKKEITFINMYKELADEESNFNDKYTKDGLHPNDLGYARISQVRLKYIYDLK